MTELGTLIDWTSSLEPWLLYIILVLSAFIENVFPPFPGDTVVLFGAYMAGRGLLNLPAVFISISIGGFTGFYIIYYFSYKKGRPFLAGRKYGPFSEKNLRRAERLYDKYGDKVVLFNRFFPAFRSMVALSAGLGGMKPAKFLVYGFLGTFIWNALIVSLGALLGIEWQKIGYLFKVYNRGVALVLLVLAVIAFFVYKSRINKRKGPGEGESNENSSVNGG